MSLFDQWPYTNFHELNLDWILESLRVLEHTIDQFVAINALKYADPIQWNIVSQYEKNTIVIDPLTGTAYISVQPVPSGVALTRDEYWTVVFDLGSFVVRAAKNFTDRWESQWTLTATFPSNVGDWLVWNDTLYKVISNIVAGDQYVIDSNIEHFTMEDTIGHLEDLSTTDKSSVVAAINEVAAEVLGKIGDLADLNTTDKSNLVAAINEVVGEIGGLTDLDTTDKSNLVAAINEINTQFQNLEILNVKDFGAVGDGVTDDTQAFTDCIVVATRDSKSIFIPSGSYLITSTIQITFNKTFAMFGVGDNSQILHSTNSKLFEFTNRANLFSVRDLRITSTDTVKTSGSAAFTFTGGCYRILFNNVRYDIDNESDLPNRHFSDSFFTCPGDKSCDTVAFNNCYFEHIDGHAIELGHGSSIWVTGGRIVGTWFTDRRGGSIGIYCNGDMGGVYLVSVDLIELFIGLQLANNISARNREFFISNVTFDGDNTGVDVNDNSDYGTFIELTGCWICTSEALGIYVHPNNAPILKVNNCYFYNTGHNSATPTNSYALDANGGQISISNSKFYKNLGYAVYLESTANCLINSCEFSENYTNGAVRGKITLSNNIFSDGTIVRGDYDTSFYNNIGYDGVTTPAVPPANNSVINQTGQRVLVVIETANPVDVYLNSVQQDVKTLVLKPNDIISLGYVDAPSWAWFALS